MSVLEDIRSVTDTLNEYLAGAGNKSLSVEGTEEQQNGWRADILQVSQSLSEVPQQSWMKQSSQMSEENERGLIYSGRTGSFTADFNDPPTPIGGARDPMDQSNASQPHTPSMTGVDLSRASTSITYSSAPASDRLIMEGFAKTKDLLQNYKITTTSRRKKPYMCLGDLGIVEGWTSILTNAAYCYDNTPAQGWRREVAIRMSGKSKGSTDIHYVTPDKRRRFRSRQELHTYMSRAGMSMSFLNAFDFRSVFCVCHEPEDSSRSYLECSYGFGGCNRWLHPECLGLGSRSEQELALMPKVICPYCAAYLKGTGEFEAFVTPDMHVYETISQPPPDEGDENDDEIESSTEPHLLWGLQGSPYVFCSASGTSGLDAPASQDYEDYPPGYNGYAENAVSPAQQHSSTAQYQDEHSQKLPQHRLFQAWRSAGAGNEETNTPTRTAPAVFSTQAGAVAPGPVEDKILSDDDKGVPSNKNNLLPGERVRRARHEDGSTTFVRVTGGWMPKRRHESETNHHETPTNGVAEDAAAAAIEAEDMKQRILAKAAARKAASSDIALTAGATKATSVLAQRYKEEIIEAAIASAKSSSHRPKQSFDAVRLSSALVAAVEPLPSAVLTELREALRSKPSLAYLPLEDGGLRYGVASYANVPRSLHAFCMANLMCGVCLTSTDNDLIQLDSSAHAYAPILSNSDEKETSSGKHKSKKAKKTHNDSKDQFVEPELDRFNLVPIVCGAVTYSAHKQCAHDASGALFDVSEETDAAGEPLLSLGEVYQYEQVDDNDCDLCSRKGGLMRYFSLSAKCSSAAPPSEEGWLAHLPCINFLHASGLLSSISLTHKHNFSNRIGWKAAGESSAKEDGLERKFLITDQDGLAVQNTDTSSTNASSNTEEQDADAEARKAAQLLDEDRLQPRAPLSRFDQMLGQHRCALCGLQCGVVLRCAAAGCGVRAHPLCAQACADPAWQVCEVASEETSLAKRDEVDGRGKERGGALTLLCSLHSVDYLQD